MCVCPLSSPLKADEDDDIRDWIDALDESLVGGVGVAAAAPEASSPWMARLYINHGIYIVP